MKVLQLRTYFPPEHAASSYLSENLVESIISDGIEIIVYAPTPCRGISKEQRKEYCSQKHRCERMYDGKMIVHRFPMFAEGEKPILRALRYVLCWTQHFISGLYAKDIDCIYLSSTPPIQGLLGAFLKKLKKVPFVYNLQDIFPDSLVGTGLAMKGGMLWKIGRVIENFTYRHADKIIVISEDFKKNIMEKGVPEEKIVVVYNWVDQNAVVPIQKEDNLLFEEFQISRDKFHVVYAGNLGNAQNIDVIIDAAKEMEDNNNVEFLIFGSGGLKDQYEQKVKDYGIQNVRFFPLQPMNRVSQVYGLGDVCVVSCKPGLGGAAMPSKMVSIMSAGRAVAASFDAGELTHILDHYNCGRYAPAGDAHAFAEMINSMAVDTSACEEMGKNARQLILDRFTREVGTQKYVDVIKEVCGRS